MFKYFLLILGCQFNYYDAEKLACALDNLGGRETTSPKDADLGIVFACSVRQKAADRILGHIRNWKKSNPKIKTIITACVLPSDKKRFTGKADLVADSNGIIKRLPRLLGGGTAGDSSEVKEASENREGNTQSRIKPHDDLRVNALSNPRSNYQLFNSHTAYVTITAGCNNFCTYCAVPYTRGRETSKPAPMIIAEINDLVNNKSACAPPPRWPQRGLLGGERSQRRPSHIDHIILLGQNVNSYGLSDYSPRDMRKNISPTGKPWTPQNPSPFVELLRKIEVIDRVKKISFLSPNPQDMSDDLIDWMGKSPKFSRELNLPLQSGSDRILRSMNRRYSTAEYLTLVRELRTAVPDIKLSTDIIVGFSGESNKDFHDTVKLVKKCKFNKAFIAMYSPRSGTAAACLDDDVPYITKKHHWQVLNSLINK